MSGLLLQDRGREIERVAEARIFERLAGLRQGCLVGLKKFLNQLTCCRGPIVGAPQITFLHEQLIICVRQFPQQRKRPLHYQCAVLRVRNFCYPRAQLDSRSRLPRGPEPGEFVVCTARCHNAPDRISARDNYQQTNQDPEISLGRKQNFFPTKTSCLPPFHLARANWHSNRRGMPQTSLIPKSPSSNRLLTATDC